MTAANNASGSNPSPGDAVANWHELLLLPFRLTEKKPFSTSALNLADIGKHIEQSGHWQRVTDAHIAAYLGDEPVDAAQQHQWTRRQHLQAYQYFHASVRSFLFGSQTVATADSTSTNDYLHWWRRSDLKALTVTTAGERGATVRFEVLRCDLAMFQPDVGVLQLELRAAQAVALPTLFDMRDQLRRLYPPYFDSEADRAGRFPAKVTVAWAPGHAAGGHAPSEFDAPTAGTWADQVLQPGTTSAPAGTPRNAERGALTPFWAELLDALYRGDTYQLIAQADDRAPIASWIALRDDQTLRNLSRGQWVRLAFADGNGNDPLPYAHSFLQNFERDFCYDRFWYAGATEDSGDSPSRILNSGYAFTMVGSAANGWFNNARDGGLCTFRQIYSRMALIAQFQRMALLGATARLSYLSHRDNVGKLAEYDQRHDAIMDFYRHFLEFTQVFWFDEVSPQEQGVELYQQWRRRLRIQELYDEVRQELRDIVEYVEARAQGKQTEETTKLTRTAGWLGGLGVVAGLLGMNILEFGACSTEKVACLKMSAWGLEVVVSAIGLTLLVGVVAYKWPKIKGWFTPRRRH